MNHELLRPSLSFLAFGCVISFLPISHYVPSDSLSTQHTRNSDFQNLFLLFSSANLLIISLYLNN